MPSHPARIGMRINEQHIFFGLASQYAYERFLVLEESIDGNQIPDNEEQEIKLYQETYIAGVQVIVFSAMCFEAAIYDYAASHLGDKYAKDHLEKLDIVSKWIVIPKLICQREIRKEKAPFGHFKQLIKSRNLLIHHKSEGFRPGDKDQWERLMQEHKKFDHDVHNAFRALVLMSLEMDHLLGPMANPLPSYSNDADLYFKPPPKIVAIVEQCKKVFRDSMA